MDRIGDSLAACKKYPMCVLVGSAWVFYKIMNICFIVNMVGADEDTIRLTGKFIDFGILQKDLTIANILRRQSLQDVILLPRGILNIL